MKIDKVIMVLLDYEDMENVNITQDMDSNHTDNWVDLSTFEYYEELSKVDDTKANLFDFITPQEVEALRTGQADYVAFRLDN